MADIDYKPWRPRCLYNTRFYFISCHCFILSGYQSEAYSISCPCNVSIRIILQKYVKIGIFPIPIACWSGFGIFNENRGNPDEIGMVGQSVGISAIEHTSDISISVRPGSHN